MLKNTIILPSSNFIALIMSFYSKIFLLTLKPKLFGMKKDVYHDRPIKLNTNFIRGIIEKMKYFAHKITYIENF
jgi:hypothetical protein